MNGAHFYPYSKFARACVEIQAQAEQDARDKSARTAKAWARMTLSEAQEAGHERAWHCGDKEACGPCGELVSTFTVRTVEPIRPGSPAAAGEPGQVFL